MYWRNAYKGKLASHLFTIPFIWLPLPFFIVTDIFLEMYHQICFPIYGLEKVKRDEYIQVIDRNKLKYLRLREKIGCMYCGYVNGLLLYQKEIASRTESYWCGVMHENKPGYKTDQYQVDKNFPEFGDINKFNKLYK
ncbi:hypothetical protein A2872_02690 [Candidatus Gottesmanbacteria bacterium RIFCSPHIGHO2_01_FULL_42_12]|uniref:Uncharacterized protein n=1 Tax=Candidatus Gottesmanbacteria bacterium RIFCSPHIGHO2_01_FULL_42_12 TaxID=1798377 RepID=A0A1F5Z0K8_9BACT|nr:MAG: hypothetical protein A2872_02690 [Candidatus Gottesmanbacteria bacterium RIFCSPHIGHO2_01_FULL_42_12]